MFQRFEEDEAHMRLIGENQTDDMPRFVFADKLQERDGQDPLPDFIRAQLKHESAKEKPAALIRKNRERWQQILAGDFPLQLELGQPEANEWDILRLERGLPGHLKLLFRGTMTSSLHQLLHHPALFAVRRLELTGYAEESNAHEEPNIDQIVQAPFIPYLRALRLEHCLPHISCNLQRLQMLEIEGLPHLDDDQSTMLENAPQIEKLIVCSDSPRIALDASLSSVVDFVSNMSGKRLKEICFRDYHVTEHDSSFAEELCELLGVSQKHDLSYTLNLRHNQFDEGVMNELVFDIQDELQNRSKESKVKILLPKEPSR